MKKILFISYDGMTDPLGQSQVIPYLAGLTKHGYAFTILSCDKAEAYAVQKDYVQNLLKGLPIEWVSLPYHKSPPVLSSMYDVLQLRKKAKQLHKKNNFQMVHTRPGIPTLVALWLKKKYNIKFLNDVRGFWADERVDGGMWNISNPIFKKIYRFFKKHEEECLQIADYVTCLTHAAKREMLSWKHISNQPIAIEVIPCSADLALFDPNAIDQMALHQFRMASGINKDDVVFSYLGSIGGWYLADDMLRFCKVLSEKIPAAKFLFISPHRHEQIIEVATKHNLSENRIITIKAARHEVPMYLSLSSYSIFFIKPCYSKISSSPTKHGEIMAMGIPVITNSGVGDVKEIVEQYKAGFVLDDFSAKSFETMAHTIVTNPFFDRAAIRQGANEFYNLNNAIESYAKVYKKNTMN